MPFLFVKRWFFIFSCWLALPWSSLLLAYWDFSTYICVSRYMTQVCHTSFSDGLAYLSYAFYHRFFRDALLCYSFEYDTCVSYSGLPIPWCLWAMLSWCWFFLSESSFLVIVSSLPLLWSLWFGIYVLFLYVLLPCMFDMPYPHMPSWPFWLHYFRSWDSQFECALLRRLVHACCVHGVFLLICILPNMFLLSTLLVYLCCGVFLLWSDGSGLCCSSCLPMHSL